MKTPMLKICIPLALVFAAGCATQSTGDKPGASSGDKSSSSMAMSRGTGSGSMSGTSDSGMARSQPGDRSVFFEFDKSALSAEDRKVVEANAQYLKDHPDVKARVEGNTDERGSKEYNLALGQRRAAQVKRYLVSKGIDGARLTTQSMGESQPAVQGSDEGAYQQNRRAEFEARNAGSLVRPRA